MGGQELSLLSAEVIMGWDLAEESWVDSDGRRARSVSDWFPAVDSNAAFEMESRIKEIGLASLYTAILGELIDAQPGGDDGEGEFARVHAHPKLRCRAALIAALDL